MVQKIPGTDQIDLTKLDPNDPEVYNNLNLLSLLPIDLQVMGLINRVQSGQSTGNETMDLEAMLIKAGYDATIDGQFSTNEQAMLQHFEDTLKDKNFKEAGMELIKMVLGTVEGAIPVLPNSGPSGTQAKQVTPTQIAATKVFMKLLSDPM